MPFIGVFSAVMGHGQTCGWETLLPKNFSPEQLMIAFTRAVEFCGALMLLFYHGCPAFGTGVLGAGGPRLMWYFGPAVRAYTIPAGT